jgi:hypothetical protein
MNLSQTTYCVILLIVFGIFVGIICLAGATYRHFHHFPEKKPAASFTVVIDGCEYIGYGTHGFTHKGNCTNSIHIYNRQ